MKTYLHTTPEVRAARQAAIQNFVAEDIKRDQAAVAFMTGGLISAGTVAAVLINAASPKGLPTAAPGSIPYAPNDGIVAIQSLPSGTLAPTDPVGAIADKAAQSATLRQDGKKVDTFVTATTANKYSPDSVRDRSLDTGRGPVRNTSENGKKAGERTLGEEKQITGNGAGFFVGGRYYAPPQVAPSIPNFKPVE